MLARGGLVDTVIFVTSGWAARSRYTPDGKRQIVHVLLPGDVVTPDVLVLKRMDHEIEALSTLSARFVRRSEFQALLLSLPRLACALWWASAQEDSLVREHVVRLGRRSALERIAHFILELHRRLLIVGQASEGAMIMPVTQSEIGDALGLSNVHVSKTLSKLQSLGHIKRTRTLIQLLDVDGLAELCDFDVLHFHLRPDLEAAS